MEAEIGRRSVAGRFLKAHLNHGPVFLVFGAISGYLLRLKNPLFDSDHPYFAAHMFVDKVFFLKNGLFRLPYYSPAFVGGTPNYAHPQDMYFSIAQWIVNLVPDFTVGYRLACVASLFLAYAGFYFFLRSFDIDRWVASFVALSFSLNGQPVLQLYGGTMSSHTYWTLPWILLNVHGFWKARSWRERTPPLLWAAFLLSLIVYGGGYYVFVFAFVLGGTFLSALYVAAPEGVRPPWRTVLAFIAACGLMALLMSLSRLMAVFDYMSVFPRPFPNEAVGYLKGLRLIVQGLFHPLAGYGSSILKPEIWGWEETSSYMGATSLAVLAAGGLSSLRGGRFPQTRTFAPAAKFFVVWTMVLLPLVYLLFVGDSFVWRFLKPLPVFKSLHVTPRYMGLVPFALLGLAAGLLSGRDVSRRWMSIAAAAILALDVGCYHAFHGHFMKGHGEDIASVSLKEFEIKGWKPEFQGIYGLARGWGDIYSYESLFYNGALVGSRVDPRFPPTHLFPDGTYNVNDPAAFLYPDEIGREAWSRLPDSFTGEQVRRFLRFEDPGFFVPFRQKAANGISLVSVAIWLAALSFFHWKKRDGR